VPCTSAPGPSLCRPIDLEAAADLTRQGLDGGAHTIAWHLSEQHQLTVSEADNLRTLQRAGLIIPSRTRSRKPPMSATNAFVIEVALGGVAGGFGFATEDPRLGGVIRPGTKVLAEVVTRVDERPGAHLDEAGLPSMEVVR
jgi:hypothetical protein